MVNNQAADGVAHKIPDDMMSVIVGDPTLSDVWQDLTPLARNEWICWTISVKKPETRVNHIERMRTELLTGKRRPCCWAGCSHRK
jgi:uncharacterized protein YdeI (YjbR/CyaY-like superfamily)